MDFLANENYPWSSVQRLRAAGHNVRTVVEELPAGKDRDVLSLARDANLVILTFDRDYGELTYRHTLLPPGGIVYFRFVPSTPEEPAGTLLKIIEEGRILLPGRFTVIERGRIRQRRLPTKR